MVKYKEMAGKVINSISFNMLIYRCLVNYLEVKIYGVSYSCLFKGKGLREPEKINKQSTNSFTLFSCGCISNKGFYKSFIINNLKLKNYATA